MCFSCLVTGVMSSTVGGLSALGIKLPQEISPPATVKGRVVSALSPPVLVGVTLFALKHLFNISLCSGGGFTLRNVVQVGGKTLPMGLIYAFGVNYLLNRYVFPSSAPSSSHRRLCCPPPLEN
jgi:hypothetical protein